MSRKWILSSPSCIFNFPALFLLNMHKWLLFTIHKWCKWHQITLVFTGNVISLICYSVLTQPSRNSALVFSRCVGLKVLLNISQPLWSGKESYISLSVERVKMKIKSGWNDLQDSVFSFEGLKLLLKVPLSQILISLVLVKCSSPSHPATYDLWPKLPLEHGLVFPSILKLTKDVGILHVALYPEKSILKDFGQEMTQQKKDCAPPSKKFFDSNQSTFLLQKQNSWVQWCQEEFYDPTWKQLQLGSGNRAKLLPIPLWRKPNFSGLFWGLIVTH